MDYKIKSQKKEEKKVLKLQKLQMKHKDDGIESTNELYVKVSDNRKGKQEIDSHSENDDGQGSSGSTSHMPGSGSGSGNASSVSTSTSSGTKPSAITNKKGRGGLKSKEILNQLRFKIKDKLKNSSIKKDKKEYMQNTFQNKSENI